MIVLVINAGSSSIKYQLYRMPEGQVLARGIVERIGEPGPRLDHVRGERRHTAEVQAADHPQGLKVILDILVHPELGAIRDPSEIEAVGHRVVHGGEEFTGSVLVTDAVLRSIEKFADLAPLHNPPNLAGIRAARERLPRARQVACFDTAFHTTIPPVAHLYGLPYELYEKYRVRRYGFHGTSHRYVARRYAQLVGKDKYAVDLVTCHLGNGCSITAVRRGRSVDTSMGLTPLEGVVMGTRSGDFDPAILFYLAEKGYGLRDLHTMCNKRSGLLGISGKSNDMRNLSELAARGDARARLAIDIFCYRVRKYIGAYAAALGSLEAVVFTGGIGENAVEVRAGICAGLEVLGIRLDPERNRGMVRREGPIHADGSRVGVYVIPTDEEAAIARDTYELARAGEVS